MQPSSYQAFLVTRLPNGGGYGQCTPCELENQIPPDTCNRYHSVRTNIPSRRHSDVIIMSELKIVDFQWNYGQKLKILQKNLNIRISRFWAYKRKKWHFFIIYTVSFKTIQSIIFFKIATCKFSGGNHLSPYLSGYCSSFHLVKIPLKLGNWILWYNILNGCKTNRKQRNYLLCLALSLNQYLQVPTHFAW